MSETLEDLQKRAAWRDEVKEINTELEREDLPGWERKGLLMKKAALYERAGYRSDLIHNGSLWIQVKEK